jgi:RNA polymerase sigma-70 factor (sigma-E family)
LPKFLTMRNRPGARQAVWPFLLDGPFLGGLLAAAGYAAVAMQNRRQERCWERVVAVVNDPGVGTVAFVSAGGERTVTDTRDRAGSGTQDTEPRPDGGDAAARLAAAVVRPRPEAPAAALGPSADDPGFRDYVTSRSRSLLHMAYLLTRNQADAEDLVQVALAKTYQAWDRIEDRNALDGYVRRAIVNTHISWWRRRRLEEYPTDAIPDRAVTDHPADSEISAALSRALDRLPSRMRAAVVLRYYEDMSEAEVAEVLGISQGTVKSTVSRAVAKLRIDAELLRR